MFLASKIPSPTPSPGTPLPQYALASTTNSSPVYSNRNLRCPPAEPPSLPFGGKTSPSTTTATPSSVTSAPATLAHGSLFSFVNTHLQPCPRPGTPLCSINNDSPEEEVHLAQQLQGLQGLGPLLHSMSTSQDPLTHRIWHRILPSTQMSLCSRPCRHRLPSSPIRRPQIPVHNHRPLNTLVRSSTFGRLLRSLLCHCLPIHMGLQIWRS